MGRGIGGGGTAGRAAAPKGRESIPKDWGKYLDNIPPEHLAYVREIRGQRLGGPMGEYRHDDPGVVYHDPRVSTAFTVPHEIGHVVYREILTSRQRRTFDDTWRRETTGWSRSRTVGTRITHYDVRNPTEGFSEAYAMMALGGAHRARVQELMPLYYDEMVNIGF